VEEEKYDWLIGYADALRRNSWASTLSRRQRRDGEDAPRDMLRWWCRRALRTAWRGSAVPSCEVNCPTLPRTENTLYTDSIHSNQTFNTV